MYVLGKGSPKKVWNEKSCAFEWLRANFLIFYNVPFYEISIYEEFKIWSFPNYKRFESKRYWISKYLDTNLKQQITQEAENWARPDWTQGLEAGWYWYHTYLRLLAVCYYLEGCGFTVITDPGSLKWLHNSRNPTGRLARWHLDLLEYDFEIIHRKGAMHKML